MIYDPIPIKRCTKCKQLFPNTTEFFRVERKRTGSWCRTCHRESGRRLYAKTKNKVLERSMRWHKEHPDKVRETVQRYREGHKDQTRKACKNWYNTHNGREYS